MDIEKLREIVKNKLPEKRYIHTLGVEKVCVELAKKYGVDEEKIRVAALLHDYLKKDNVETLKEICKDMPEAKGYENLPEIFHSLAGYEVVKKEFEIDDEDILNSIKYHTIGRKNMSILEKIIYIGDAIEENRDYPNVDEIRKKTFQDIDEGIIFEISRKLEYLKEKGGIIHKNTKEMLEDLVSKQELKQ
ncbi:MAG: bis(5'-nucleosyl)-tetraphosphatase (symmetrical) YqeK [Fusobacterium sp.]|uniref:bis(5'-nucleosyl)-tetraphosphatase (symmetrical) YqeK n=1 Tax=Fusobacterium sp. TaxID=68766 RepID=UPI002A760862|nr:bis(5'-nucleosyl)-tetraphosphatase (symmetrical) YqeK [Fusobacterium sp.]MDY2980658.1 bis(5'-nucleosyl)-tetraphosphatase (symmetrical) YqeK [Fusobacterium sp.]